MAITMPQRSQRDDIDAIVDELLENPGSADAMKSLLKEKIYRPKVVKLAPAKPAEDEAEDLWDNVPV